MAENTKACSLTKDEVEELIRYHGRSLDRNTEHKIDRLKYLHGRFKAFNEIEMKSEPVPAPEEAKKDSW